MCGDPSGSVGGVNRSREEESLHISTDVDGLISASEVGDVVGVEEGVGVQESEGEDAGLPDGNVLASAGNVDAENSLHSSRNAVIDAGEKVVGREALVCDGDPRRFSQDDGIGCECSPDGVGGGSDRKDGDREVEWWLMRNDASHNHRKPSVCRGLKSWLLEPC